MFLYEACSTLAPNSKKFHTIRDPHITARKQLLTPEMIVQGGAMISIRFLMDRCED